MTSPSGRVARVLGTPESRAPAPDTVAERIAAVVRGTRTDVFLRADFREAGGRRQVDRCLRAMVDGGMLLRFGHGLYARAARSPFDGRPVLCKGIRAMAEQALHRLDVGTGPFEMTRAHDQGRSTQVPSGRVIAVDRRVRRRIGLDGVFVRHERMRCHDIEGAVAPCMRNRREGGMG